MKPIEIIGGGIAGLCLGIALRAREVPVVAREAGTYPRHRVCGEFIAGNGAAWRELGVEDLMADALAHERVAWSVMGGRPVGQRLPRPALGLSRHVLDKRLAERFAAMGGELRVSDRGPREPAEGRVLAAGRQHDPASPWVGLKGHYRLTTVAPLEIQVGRRAYVGCSAVEAGWVNVCGLFHRQQLGAKREDLLPTYLRKSGLGPLADRLEAAGPPRPGSIQGVSGLAVGPARGSGVRVGDARSMTAPLTGNGMTMAAEGALLAAPLLERYARGVVGWAEVADELARAVQERFARRVRLAKLIDQGILSVRGAMVVRLPIVRHVLPFEMIRQLVHG